MSQKTTLRPIAMAFAASVAAMAAASIAHAQTVTPVSADATPAPVEAAALLKDLGSAERIQRSGSLRMLSQRISATACNRVAGIAAEDADKYLARSVRDYRRILAGLVEGDDGLGLYGPEQNRIVLRDVAEMAEVWAPLDAIFADVETDALTPEHVAQIAETVPTLLAMSKQLLGFVVAEYSDPSQMLQSDAVLLQIAERQRMLEQEIANATCLIGDGLAVDASRAKLAEAIPLYEVSLAALRNGMPEAGVAAPPTHAIDLWLTDVADRWAEVRPTLDAIAAGDAVSEDDRRFVFEEMNKLTWMMNVTVGQYTEASKLLRY